MAPGANFEQIVVGHLIGWLGKVAEVVLARNSNADAVSIGQAQLRADAITQGLTNGSTAEQQSKLRSLIQRIDVHEAQVDLVIDVASILSNDLKAGTSDPIVIIAPATRVRRGDDVRLIVGAADPTANRDKQLITLLAEARQANAALLKSDGASLDTVADAQGHSRKHFSRLLRLAVSLR